jgi:DNA polymerase-3 subunit gamma/tau
LDAASNNSVEDIRSLIDQVRIPPQIGKYSVYIIDEVHMLSGNAFNALLKTLEEPPKHAIFILATTEKHKILATILSRCQVYDFNRITVADTISHLQYVAQKENINASEEALNVVAQKADGGMRDALSIFDQLVAFCGTNISYEQAIEVLNVLDSDYYFRLVDAALSGDVSNALLLLNEVLVKGFDAGHFITGFAQHLRDVLVSKDSATVALLETPEVIRQQYQAQAQRCAAKWLFNALDIMNTCDINYRTAKNKRLTVELALIKLCRLLEPAEPIQTNTQPTQRTAVASPQPSVKTATQPSTPIQQQATVKPTIAPPPPKPVIGAMPSLGNLGLINTNAASNQANSAQTSTGQSTTTEKRNTPFTIDQLKSAWVGQVKNFEKEERFKAMLITYEPVMDSEHMFHITVKNQLQKKVFSQFGKQLMDNIRNELQNDHIQLKVEIDEHVIGQVAYTASEKYKLLAQQNPQLDDLRQRMNLQLE